MLFRLPGHRCQTVIRFMAIRLEDRNPECLKHSIDVGKLAAQFLGHRIAIGLVLIVAFVAKGGAVTLHGDCPVTDIVILAQSKKQVGHGVNRLDLHPLVVGQGAHSVVSTIDLVAAVDQKQGFGHLGDLSNGGRKGHRTEWKSAGKSVGKSVEVTGWSRFPAPHTQNLAYPRISGNMGAQGFLTESPCGLRITASGLLTLRKGDLTFQEFPNVSWVSGF